jgi:xanthine dehydrogenase accessory factor
MTHSHALDLALVTAALPDTRFPYVGLIGSATKRALFERRLAEFGVAGDAISRLVCPIGVTGISGKSPAIIAAAVAAELLVERERADGKPNLKTELALG